MSRQIPLANGLATTIDDEDFARASAHLWKAREDRSGSFYAECKIARRTVSLHRFLLRPPPNALVDHVNGDTLDNRKTNLRLCSRSQNAANSKPRTGRFKGVSKTPFGTFRAVVHKDYRQLHLGTFATEEEAARAYDAAAVEKHGEFARLNFPNTRPSLRSPAKARQGVGTAQKPGARSLSVNAP